MLLWTVSVKNLMGYNDTMWELALCILTLRDQPMKRERVLKTKNFGKHLYLFVYFRFIIKTMYVNAVTTSPSIRYIHSSFPNFNIKMIEFCSSQIVTSTSLKHVC